MAEEPENKVKAAPEVAASVTNEAEQGHENMFLSGPIGVLFLKTALPIILVMVVNGLFNLVDAYFLGVYVGENALTAVTFMFPLQMAIFATATMVSSGMASILARRLGAGRLEAAGAVFTNAHLLVALTCALLYLFSATVGGALVESMAHGVDDIAALSSIYISIMVIYAPVGYVLALHTDALRSEGKVQFMTQVTLMAALLNILFDYLFIAHFGWGVEGSAYGTILAQTISLATVFVYRLKGRSKLKPVFSRLAELPEKTVEILSLGAPASLGFIGIALIATSVIYSLQFWGEGEYETKVGAYGIVTRIISFAYLPLMGLSLGFQAIVGNNFGAGRMLRADRSLRLVIGLALAFAALAQAIFIFFADSIGFLFVDSEAMAMETARILPLMTLLFFMFGPMMMLAGFFQAIGHAGKAAILSLGRNYLFALPLIFIMPFFFGELGIWYAGPVAEILMLMVTIYVLRRHARTSGTRYGLFFHRPEGGCQTK